MNIMKNSRLYKFLRKIAGDDVSISPSSVLEDCLDDISTKMSSLELPETMSSSDVLVGDGDGGWEVISGSDFISREATSIGSIIEEKGQVVFSPTAVSTFMTLISAMVTWGNANSKNHVSVTIADPTEAMALYNTIATIVLNMGTSVVKLGDNILIPAGGYKTDNGLGYDVEVTLYYGVYNETTEVKLVLYASETSGEYIANADVILYPLTSGSLPTN